MSEAPAAPRGSGPFWRLCIAMGLSTVGRSMLGTAVPLLAVALGLTPFWVGALVALPNALPVVLGMRAGGWVDRTGAGRWIVGGVAGIAGASFLVVASPDAWGLAFAQLLIGLAQLAAGLASQSLVPDVGASGSLERDYATYATLLSTGRLIGPLLVGILIDATGFRGALAVAGATSALALLLVAEFALREVPARQATKTGAAAEPAAVSGERWGVRDAWRNVGVQLAVLASAGVFIAISVRQAFLPVLLETLDYSATEIGGLVSLGALASVAVRPFMPVVSRWLRGPARSLAVGLAVTAVAVGLLGSARSLPAFAALSVAAGLATGVGLPLSVVTVAGRVEKARRGAALGLRLASNRAAQLVTPLIVGALIGWAGFAAGFALVGAVVAALAVAVVRRIARFEDSES